MPHDGAERLSTGNSSDDVGFEGVGVNQISFVLANEENEAANVRQDTEYLSNSEQRGNSQGVFFQGYRTRGCNSNAVLKQL